MRENFLYSLVKKYQITKSLFIGYFIALSAILYFLFFIIFGSKGLIQLFKISEQVKNKENAKKEIIAKMNSKQNLVKGMDPNSLDIDLLDEQARKVLGYVGKNEVVIYQDQPSPKEQ